MGVTIHWRGQLRDKAALAATVQTVRDFAAARGWPVRDIAPEVRELFRVEGDKIVTYEGPSCGISVRPHRDSETATFEFDRDGHLQSSCKTQFAGRDVHIAVVELLSCVAPHFRELHVYDEGGYWETRDARILSERLGAIDRAIDAIAARLPGARARVPVGGRMPPDDDGPETKH